jgi:uncharacterized protein YndB with AHSA1/START domain
MAAIRHRIGVEAPLADVYDAVATREGVASWWTRHVEGESRVGGQLAFWFGGDKPAAVMEIEELSPAQRVVWRCVDGPAEWCDTTVTFDLRDLDGESVVLFTHDGWREPVEFMHHCSTRWGYFLLSCKFGLESGNATPWPDDVKADRWG